MYHYLIKCVQVITNDEVALAGDGLEDWPVRYVRPGRVGEVPVVRVRYHLPRPASGHHFYSQRQTARVEQSAELARRLLLE
jgi:hypothetical protein